MAADFEYQRGSEGGIGEVVADHGDGVVGLVFFLVPLDDESFEAQGSSRCDSGGAILRVLRGGLF